MKRKIFDCIEMKRKIQEQIHEETKHLSRKELIAYFREHAEAGPFAHLWKGPVARRHSKLPTRRR